VLDQLREDLAAARQRDPAARSSLEVALCYSGVHALWAYRLSHRLWGAGYHLWARLLAAGARLLTGVEIHPAAVLGARLFIDHGHGVVIGETAVVGDDVTIYQGVTLGGTSLQRGKRHPTVGDGVTIGAGAKVLGPIDVGAGSRIGANAVVVKPVPENSVVVGVPGQVVIRSRPTPTPTVEMADASLPDLIETSLRSFRRRLDALETTVAGAPDTVDAMPSAAGVWSGDDFSI